jgi:nitroimidazol reductase NimA-like FMN-containing flavoprotein (pyridoxamine 5'-phosphate oxidase superfamily)
LAVIVEAIKADLMKAIPEQIRVRRGHESASYDDAEIKSIIDAGYIAHVAFVHNGLPVSVPMIYWREGDFVLWHGSTKSRAMLASAGDDVCLTITHLDALAFARSAFHHSANYRCVMLFGVAEPVPAEQKVASLHNLMERIAPGRDEHLRPMHDKELKATALLRIPIDQVSAKIKSGPPNGDPDDQNWPVWEGIVPIKQTFQTAISAGLTEVDLLTPDHIARLQGTKI